jgi:predicted AAA+ superfamily ATPase
MVWVIMTDYLQRELAGPVTRALEALPVVVVTGARQTGKTTFLREEALFRGRRYLSLDDFATLEAARRDPLALLEAEEPLTIDEAQRCPELLVAVKQVVDRRRIPGRFILSGSANFALLKGVSETLAGRALYLTLHPFTRREAMRALGAPPFLLTLLATGKLPKVDRVRPIREEEVLDGGLPPVALREVEDRGPWFTGYEQTYLERDLRQLSQVADLVSFRNLLRLAALRTAQVLNHSELARDAKLPVSTVTRHLGLLETSFVLARLAPYLRNRATRLIKSPKLFVSDSGLAGHLTGVSDLRAQADEPLRGALFETYVHQNLAGILQAHDPRAELAFWNVQGRHEVDFVVTSGRRSLAIEVKAAARFAERDLSGLRAFREKASGLVAGVLAYNGTEAASLGDELYAIPLGLLLA